MSKLWSCKGNDQARDTVQTRGLSGNLCQTAGDAIDCLLDIGANIDLVDIIESYLLAQDTEIMTSGCINYTNLQYALLAEVQDRLGWDSFVEDRISTLFLEMVRPFLVHSCRRSLEKWGCSFH